MAAVERAELDFGSSTRRLLVAFARPLVVLSVVVSVLAAGQLPAAACSCDTGDIGGALQHADGAFIGTLVSSAPVSDIENPESHWFGYAFTFEVTEWLKGEREPERFDVHSAGDGSACGFGVNVGQEAAIFVSVQDGRATGGLCSTYDAASVRATIRPPAPSGEPGVFVATEWRQPTLVLDAEGGLVATQPAGADHFGTLHTVCGGSIIAEHRHNHVVLRDLTTFEELEVLQLARPTEQIMCQGDRVLALAGTAEFHRVYDVRTREPVSPIVAEGSPAFLRGDEVIYMAEADADDPQGWRTIDLSSGVERDNLEMSTSVKRMESVDVSPDGSRIALTLAEGNQAVLQLVLVSVATGEVSERTINTHVAVVRWLDDTQLFVGTDSGGFAGTALPFIASGENLATLDEFGAAVVWPTRLDGDRLIGFKRGRIQAIPLGGGRVEVLNELPTDFQRELHRLSEPVLMSTTGADRGVSMETPIPSPVIEALATSSELVGERDGDTGESLPAAADDVSLVDNELASSPFGETKTSVLGTVAIVLACLAIVGISGAFFHFGRKT